MPQALRKLRLFHVCLLALLPLAIFVVGLRLDWFPRANWTLRRAFALSVGPLLKWTPDLKPAAERLNAATGQRLSFPLDSARLVVRKKQRQAELYSGQQLIKTYTIALGEHPEGTKQTIGDNRTPEGQYYICTCLYRSVHHVFLGINYPNGDDAQKGLAQGHITPAVQTQVQRSERRQCKPAWDTPLGGSVGVHGGGTRDDWTEGCIALENTDIEEICLATHYWTPVEILP